MTAYSLTPVGPEGPEKHRERIIWIPRYSELLVENERLKSYLQAAKEDVDTYRQMWRSAHDERIKAEVRSTRAFRVLASIGRLSPWAAALIERGRVEVYGELP